MNLTSPSQVKAWCIENGFHPNKVMGQNFLVDRNTLEAIVDAGLEGVAGESPSVLEIGPGLGVLTEELLRRGCRVTAVEKDAVLAARLAESLGSPNGLTVIAGDALAALERQTLALDGFDAMISNLPYQAGTRILLDLVIARAPAAMTVLVQAEVAERLAAREGSKARSLAGVWAQLDYDVRILRKVPPTCFWPRPQIGSCVVRLDRHDRGAALTENQRRMFRSMTKRAFSQRRKQLGRVLKDMVQSTLRAEELTNEDWIALTKGLTENEDT